VLLLGSSGYSAQVAGQLGLAPATVEPVDRESRQLAGEFDVVVIAGEDRAS